jgi:hypothetical protein
MKSKLVALALFCLSISPSATAEESRVSSTLCAPSGNWRQTVHLRIISPWTSFRVSPSARDVIKLGADQSLRRDVFEKIFQKRICDQSFPEVKGTEDKFDIRIVIYVEGEEDRELLSLTYPSWEDQPPPVWARMNGKTVLMPASAVRQLLDATRPNP